MSKFKINNKGFWEDNKGEGHVFDEKLCDKLIKFLLINNIKTCVDLGCGMGDYTKNMLNNNIQCDAYDGNPYTPILTGGIGKVLDFSNNFDLNKTYDCVLSLEVGEHIPKEYEQIFIDNLTKHSNKLLIISWAIIGQGGDGHVNCQNNKYIINEIEKRRFKYDLESSIILRESSNTAPWFKDTIMVFNKI
jgi:hypothetical protein